jgi:putative protease
MNFWYKQGVKRVVLARELGLKEVEKIRDNIPEEMDIEAFVHGAMCISYSGRCLLSNYMTDRDANRGACSHPCRWKYYLVEEKRPGEYQPIVEDERGTYIYNSKDMCMIQDIDKVIEAGVTSLKIEGRMKTPHYVASVVNSYRRAIDDYYNGTFDDKREYYYGEVSKASHRDYTTGFYFGKADDEAQIYTKNSYIRTYDFVGMVLDYDKETKIATVEQRNKFLLGEELEVLKHSGENFNFKVEVLQNDAGEDVESAPHPKQILKIKIDKEVEKYDILRKEITKGERENND